MGVLLPQEPRFLSTNVPPAISRNMFQNRKNVSNYLNVRSCVKVVETVLAACYLGPALRFCRNSPIPHASVTSITHCSAKCGVPGIAAAIPVSGAGVTATIHHVSHGGWTCFTCALCRYRPARLRVHAGWRHSPAFTRTGHGRGPRIVPAVASFEAGHAGRAFAAFGHLRSIGRLCSIRVAEPRGVPTARLDAGPGTFAGAILASGQRGRATGPNTTPFGMPRSRHEVM